MKASHLFATADVSALADPQPVSATGLLAINEYVNAVSYTHLRAHET